VALSLAELCEYVHQTAFGEHVAVVAAAEPATTKTRQEWSVALCVTHDLRSTIYVAENTSHNEVRRYKSKKGHILAGAQNPMGATMVQRRQIMDKK
jgi:hypothetical protein